MVLDLIFYRTILFSIVLFLAAPSSCLAFEEEEKYDQLSKKTSQVLMEEGRHFFEKRQAAKALSRFMIVSKRYRESNNREETELSIRALNNAGCVYKYLYYNYLQAYECYNEAYRLCEEKHYDEFRPVIMLNMGDLFLDYGTFHNSDYVIGQAESMFEKCFRIGEKEKNWDLMTTSFFNLSNLNYEIDLSKFGALFRKDIPPSSTDIEYARLQYLGIEKLQQHKYKESREFFERQLDAVSTPWESDRALISAHINIAHSYEMEEDYANEASQLEKALEISKQSDLKELTAHICRELAESYGNLGNDPKRREARQLYLEKIDEIRNSRISNIAESKYLNDIKNEQQKAQELMQKQRRNRYVIIVMVIFLLLSLLFILLVWRTNRKLKENARSLYEKYQQLLAAEKLQKESKTAKTSIKGDQRETIESRIRHLLEDPEVFCSMDFSSKELARLADSNTTYVSKIINETYGISFSTLIGNLRVKEACRRINESDCYDALTIEGIANNMGFKSRTSFINAFKREVGISPSEYIRIAREARKKNT